MEYGIRVKRYIEAFNGFQFNTLRPITRLKAKDLAAKLGISYLSFTKLQNTSLFSKLVINPDTYENIIKLIDEYKISFPDSYTVVVNTEKLKVCSPITILTTFQYRVAVFLLYGRYTHLKNTNISLIHDYFGSLDDWESLENSIEYKGLVSTIKQEFEDRGLCFPNPYSVRISPEKISKTFTKEELQELFCQNKEFTPFKYIDLVDIKLLRLLIEINAQDTKEFEIDYKYLEPKMNLSGEHLRKRLAKLERGGFIARSKKNVKMGNILRKSVVHVKLYTEIISKLSSLKLLY